MKQIYEMYQIDNLKMQDVIGEEMAKHLIEQFLHLMKSIDESIAVYDFTFIIPKGVYVDEIERQFQLEILKKYVKY